ncbi:putative dioxygenase [Pseudolycoriella hygida]|uniref:Dioxygenase n=1 Tax=Pseudolycoriella hygida TaxID=35572 RepID=A0A9Q0NGM4_9DIPT|nr:putative dioxygenase [Pseudolycoriella hygida]
MSKFYELVPRKIGCDVLGIDLNTESRPEVIEQIKRDVTEHRLLVFPQQGIISGARHVEISKWFGELESTFYKHERSPHPDVFRVSNDGNEGCRGVGRTGWHIDGSFQPEPFAYSLYHMVSVPKEGATQFLPLTELVENLDEETFARWNQLWMISDRRTGPVHPLIYNHPKTNKTVRFVFMYFRTITNLPIKSQVLCFHLGMTERFIWNYKKANEKWTSADETNNLLDEIHEVITIANKNLIYKHDWQPGEFIISDNLAVGHEATVETQYPRDKVGLRVLHRTTIKGVHRPQK